MSSKTVPPKQGTYTKEFFKNFAVETVDNAGRTSLRQVLKSEGEGRTSLIGLTN